MHHRNAHYYYFVLFLELECIAQLKQALLAWMHAVISFQLFLFLFFFFSVMRAHVCVGGGGGCVRACSAFLPPPPPSLSCTSHLNTPTDASTSRTRNWKNGAKCKNGPKVNVPECFP